MNEEIAPSDVTPALYHARNAAIVRRTDWLVAVWDDRQHGGTWRTIEHALSVSKPVFNAFAGFERITDPPVPFADDHAVDVRLVA